MKTPTWLVQKQEQMSDAEEEVEERKAKAAKTDTGAKATPPAKPGGSGASAGGLVESEEAKTRRSRAASSKEVTLDNEQAVVVVAKLSLQNSQMLRQLAAAVTLVQFLMAGEAVVQACMETSKNYDKAVRAKGKGHGLGAPHNHVFATFVLGLLEEVSKKPSLLETPQYAKLGKVQEFVVTAADSSVVGQVVAYFRIKEIQTKGSEGENQAKVTLSFNVVNQCQDDNEVMEPRVLCRTLTWGMQQISAGLKTRPAPRGELERVVEKVVQERASRRK